MKTLEDLNSKIWFRLLKVINIIISFMLISYVGINSASEIIHDVYWIDDNILYIILTLLFCFSLSILFFYLLCFQVINRIFYYIVLGTLFPKKKENA